MVGYIFQPKTTIQIRLRACRRPSFLSPVKPLRHQTLETPFGRFNKVPIPWDGTQGDPREAKGRLRGPKGTQGQPTGGDPTVPTGAKGSQGEPRAPSAPLGGTGPRAIWDYSEAISNGKQFRVEGYHEWEDILRRKLI